MIRAPRNPLHVCSRFMTSVWIGIALCWLSIGAAPAAVDAAARALLPDDVRDKGVLSAGLPLDYEPFNFIDDSKQPTGLDVEILRAVADKLGLTVDIQRIGFASLIPSISGGRIDVGMSAMAILKQRLAVVSFVRYGLLSSSLIVRKGNPTNLRVDGELCGHTISVEKGTSTHLLWERLAKACETAGKPKVDLLIFEGKGPQVLAVENGRAEAAGFGYATVLVVARNSQGHLEPAPGGSIPGATTESGIAIRKDRVKLGQAIEAALKSVVADGTYDRIFEKWGLSRDRATPQFVQEQP
ncbi:MAG TPA: ABC transporter substrate-binding protein [Casimicrobiaceae bacterium]|nr:ABC transporter substrate-binding protein [Casimicrobiaceae bacterium]